MIHLDANLLIAMVNPSDPHHAFARSLALNERPLCVSSVTWMEFSSRPVAPLHIQALRRILTGGIHPFDEPAAALAGDLFFRTGSKRRTRLDTMIAATAILIGGELATANPGDFEPFVPLGLNLLPMEKGILAC